MTTLAARLPDDLLARLDDLVEQGAYRTRTEAVRTALERLLADVERSRIDEAIREGYRRLPPEPTTAEQRARAIASIEEEPW